MKHPDLVHGLELLPCAIRDGMLYIPHADGNWVSAAKLQPFSLAIIEHWRAEQAPPVDAVPGEPVAVATLRDIADLQGPEIDMDLLLPVRMAKTALATPVASRAAGSEPVAWQFRWKDRPDRWFPMDERNGDSFLRTSPQIEVRALYAIAPAATAEPSDPLQRLTDISQELGLYESPGMNAGPVLKLLQPQPAPVRDVVPGKVACAKCNFSLQRVNLYVNAGTVGAGGEETEPCPNDGTPLLPVTWEQEARECWKSIEQWCDRAVAAEKDADRARAASLAVPEDTKRLDWLDREMCEATRQSDAARTLRISWNNGADRVFVGSGYRSPWREAIDLAMLAATPDVPAKPAANYGDDGPHDGTDHHQIWKRACRRS